MIFTTKMETSRLLKKYNVAQNRLLYVVKSIPLKDSFMNHFQLPIERVRNREKKIRVKTGNTFAAPSFYNILFSTQIK